MNLFDQQFSESDLIAFHLNELSPRRERALRRALDKSPALAAEAATLATMLRDFKKHAAEPAVSASGMERSWDAVRASIAPIVAQPPRAAGRAATARAAIAQLRMPVLAGSGVAALATLALVAGLHHAKNVRDAASGGGAASEHASGSSAAAAQGGDELQQPSMVAAESPFHTLQSAEANSFERSRDAHTWRGNAFGAHSNARARLIPLATREDTTLHYPSYERVPAMQPMPLLLPEPKGLHVVPVPYTPLAPNTASLASTARPRKHHDFDLMLAMGGDFIASQSSITSSGAGATLTTSQHTQAASHAVMAIAAIHQQLRPFVGYRVTVSYTRPDFRYSYGGSNTYGSFSNGSQQINSRIYEAAGTYVAQGPHVRKLRTTADAGAGVMVFLPTNDYQSTGNVYRGAGILGVNADLPLTKHLGIRAGFRAQLFKSPDFRNMVASIPVTSRVTVSNEPFVGITYRFGGVASN